MSSAENIGVVSDIHLGFSNAQVDAFSAFLDLPETRKLKKLILLGDILDFWVADDKTIFENVHHILWKIERLNCEKILVIGNHDYILSGYIGKYIPDLQIIESYTCEVGNKTYLFIHGHQFDRIFKLFRPLYIAGLLSVLPDIQRWITKKAVNYSFTRWIWDKLLKYLSDRPKYKTFEEMVKERYYRFVKIPSDATADALIYGHTHVPQLTEKEVEGRTYIWGNTGSWVKESEEVYNTSIFIDQTGPTICHYKYSPDTGELKSRWCRTHHEPRSYLDAQDYRDSMDFLSKIKQKR